MAPNVLEVPADKIVLVGDHVKNGNDVRRLLNKGVKKRVFEKVGIVTRWRALCMWSTGEFCLKKSTIFIRPFLGVFISF